jgi:hypothetical protein
MNNIREKFLNINIFFGILIVVSTELLSFFNYINSFSVKLLWLTIFFFFLFFFFKKKKKFLNIKKFYLHDCKSLFILIVFFLTLLIALIYPPNTFDSLSYNMPRVMNWIQSNNVNFYPTNDLRELVMGPRSQFIILHFSINR